MRNHVRAFEHRRVFHIDAILDKHEIEYAVFVDIPVQHNQKLAARIGRVIDADRHVLTRRTLTLCAHRHIVYR